MSTENEQLLNGNSWLNQLPKCVKTALIGASKIRHYTRNQRVHSKGGTPEGLYCVVEGEVRVSATTLSGGEFVFTKIQAGSWFGEIAILDEGPRTHDVYSVDESTIAVIPKNTIRMLCEENHEVYKALVNMLCKHCRQAFSAIDKLLVFSNEQRLANLIVSRLSEVDSLILKINQEELGAQVGLSRQSINKLLKAWKVNGWIDRFYGGIEVIALDELKALSE